MEKFFSNRLLTLPLFQGFSRLDFLDIVEKTPFDFRTLPQGKIIVRQDEECHALCIVMGGEVASETESPDHTYHFSERVRAPWTIQPECLFGLHNRYTHTVRAVTETQTLSLDKQSVRQLLVQLPTFQINFYNAVSTLAQQSERQLWQATGKNLTERFTQFVALRSLRPVGEKILQIRMEDLATQLDASRLRVSQMLASLAKDGLLVNSRANIVVLALEKLISYNINNSSSFRQ